MHNFFFHNPCKVIFGNDRISALGSEAKKLGHRALLVYGHSHLEKSGVLAAINNALCRAGVVVTEFGGISPNPTFDDATRGITFCHEKGCDLVVGIGGGSAMDIARAISAGFFFGNDLKPMFTGRKGASKRLPLLLVPTLPGTGSATGHGMVLRDETKGIKLGCGGARLFADTAIIDPRLMCSAPRRAIAQVAIDGFCHAMEFFCNHSANATGLQKNLLTGLARTILRSAVAATKDPDTANLAEIAWAGELTMNGIATAGLGWTSLPLHAIEHGTGGLMHTPHGAGLAFITRGWFRLQYQKPLPATAEFCRRVFQIKTGNDREVIGKGGEYFDQWLKKMAWTPPTALTKIDAGIIEKIITGALIQAGIWRIRNLDEKKIAAIIKAAPVF